MPGLCRVGLALPVWACPTVRVGPALSADPSEQDLDDGYLSTIHTAVGAHNVQTFARLGWCRLGGADVVCAVGVPCRRMFACGAHRALVSVSFVRVHGLFRVRVSVVSFPLPLGMFFPSRPRGLAWTLRRAVLDGRRARPCPDGHSRGWCSSPLLPLPRAVAIQAEDDDAYVPLPCKDDDAYVPAPPKTTRAEYLKARREARRAVAQPPTTASVWTTATATSSYATRASLALAVEDAAAPRHQRCEDYV